MYLMKSGNLRVVEVTDISVNKIGNRNKPEMKISMIQTQCDTIINKKTRSKLKTCSRIDSLSSIQCVF